MWQSRLIFSASVLPSGTELRTILMGFLFSAIFIPAFSQSRLDIEIQALKSNHGRVMLQVFDSAGTVIDSLMNSITDRTCSFSINGLPDGKYAVRYYHDENMNGRMETNIFGKPLEGYGFSNNVTGKFGPPPFNKWLFKVSGNTKITLKPLY
jgi:uncharacterized protein (DUF2141 family)